MTKPARTPYRYVVVLWGLALAPSATAAQVELCADAERFLADVIGMATVTETETIDDWRTRRNVAGCRVTAAGLTTLSLRQEARRFFEMIRGVGWTRTPDPRDAPNESSLRFRLNEVDCLFSFYSGGILSTEAEGEVDDARVPGPGEQRYNFIVLCMPEMEAAPRDTVRTRSRGSPGEGPS